MTDYLDLEDLLAAAEAALGHPAEVRDWGLLESALARPAASVFGQDAYLTLTEKAAALLHSLARNHALMDGNKRCAWVAMRLFCALNGHEVHAPTDEAEALVLAVASGQLDVPEIAKTVVAWMMPGI